mmetsp:Transcript_22139/g.46340  ORF Transcript_22139/g.46340 Transcript_22139/m.46340 type:complete len:413 (+) Transcript_22139:113-1351(+)
MSGASSEETLTCLAAAASTGGAGGESEGAQRRAAAAAATANAANAATMNATAQDDANNPANNAMNSAANSAADNATNSAADLKGIRGVYQMRTAKKDVSRYQVRVWIKRGQLKNTKSDKPWDEGNTKTKRNSGKRVHLGCFGSLASSIHAFDVAEVFFKGKYAATNKPAATYDDSPILRFLLDVVDDRTDLEEFMTVWKHLMQYRWVFDFTRPCSSVADQLQVVKTKIDMYKARADLRTKIQHQPPESSAVAAVASTLAPLIRSNTTNGGGGGSETNAVNTVNVKASSAAIVPTLDVAGSLMKCPPVAATAAAADVSPLGQFLQVLQHEKQQQQQQQRQAAVTTRILDTLMFPQMAAAVQQQQQVQTPQSVLALSPSAPAAPSLLQEPQGGLSQLQNIIVVQQIMNLLQGRP